MNRAQRWVVLVVCLVLAGVVSWKWYLGPRKRWTDFRDIAVRMYPDSPYDVARLMKSHPFPDATENVLLGIALPIAVAGAGLFIGLGRSGSTGKP